MNGSHSQTLDADGSGVGAEAGAPVVSVRGVNKSYRRDGRRVRALRDVDLDVAENEIVCLLGPSGCGKSTLLNILAGILPFDEGEVVVNGRAVQGPGADRGMLFQSPMLFPWLTTRDNVLFGPRAQGKRGATKSELREQADAILATVGLVGFEDAYPHELSGGMRHRAAFARALINRPAVLLMDEPFGALDSLTRSRMHSFLLQLWEVHHITIVFVTHDIEEAILLGDRVCVMGGSPAHIVEQIDVPLGRPRLADVVETVEFIATKRRVRGALLHD
jgi:NitT/TauT family transport system ATP-binding protein